MTVRRPDYILIGIIATLFLGGLLILASASTQISYLKFGSPSRMLLNQLFPGVVVGIIGFFAALKIPYTFWKKMALPMLLAALVLLALVFTPQLGFAAKGARRWILVGPLFFQPSEIAKLAIVIYLAAYFSKFKDGMGRLWQEVAPFVVVTGAILGLIALEPDIGTLGIIALTVGVMFFVAGGRFKYIMAFIATGAGGLLLLIQTASYRLNRLLAFIDPNVDSLGISYQVRQAVLAAGSGGLWGVGFGESLQKYSFLPEAATDSIYAVLAEELGFIGASMLLALYIAFALRALRIASRTQDAFGKYLVIGIVSWIVIQAFVNISAIIGIIPLTGVTLPFVSYGGTSLALVMTASGILVNVSKYAKA